MPLELFGTTGAAGVRPATRAIGGAQAAGPADAFADSLGNYVPPPEIEDHRDWHWRREGARTIEAAPEAERFIEEVGFTACLTDLRRPGP